MTSHLIKKLWLDASGTTAVMFGLALPVLLGLAGVAVDYTSWTNQQQKLQKAADAAALAATSELSISSADNGRLTAVAESVVKANIALAPGDSSVALTASIGANRSAVTVVLRQQKSAIMSKLVSPSLTDMEVAATATLSSSTTKICVVALESNKSRALDLDGSAKLTAMDCSIYSNSCA
jgi:Flp pilus assembly protein TadG